MESYIREITTGLNPRDNFQLKTSGSRYITVKNLTSKNSINYDGCDFVDEDAANQIRKRSKVESGDILFASIAPLGRCYTVLANPMEWVINESVFCIKPKEKYYQLYLYLLLTSNYFIKKSENSATGSVFNGIRISTINDLKILMPPKEILFSFNQKVESLFRKSHSISDENEKLLSLKNELLPLLMNGQISII